MPSPRTRVRFWIHINFQKTKDTTLGSAPVSDSHTQVRVTQFAPHERERKRGERVGAQTKPQFDQVAFYLNLYLVRITKQINFFNLQTMLVIGYRISIEYLVCQLYYIVEEHGTSIIQSCLPLNHLIIMLFLNYDALLCVSCRVHIWTQQELTYREHWEMKIY